MVKKNIEFKNMQEAVAVCGRHDENVKLIEKSTKAQLISRGNEITIEGVSKELVGQTASKIEEVCKKNRRKFYRRIFQCGIFITSKDGKDIK